MTRELKINHLAVILLAVVYMPISAGWYGLFAQPWLDFNGLTAEEAQSVNPMVYLVAFLGAVVLYYGMALVFKRMRIESAQIGALSAALLWLAFLFTQSLTQNLFSLEAWQLAFIDQGNTFVSIVLGGAVLGAWRKYGDAA